MDDSKKYWVWLSSIPGIGSVRAKMLLDYFKTPEAIWNASQLDLEMSGMITPHYIKQIVDPVHKENAEIHIKNLTQNNIGIITIKDAEYPENLKNIYDPPVVLYVKGEINPCKNSIAIVGSRRASSYGLSVAEELSYQLAKYNITVVSGMARGIDTYAHKGALNAGGRTIAVLGCGLDTVYPPENKNMMDRIIDKGAVISEYLPGVQPLSGNFPARNRIISGISLGVVVVEAGEKSGSLITSDFALEQGREVFAVPGNISSRQSKGTNRLIKEGAKIVTGVEDILEELEFLKINTVKNTEYKKDNKNILLNMLDADELKIADILSTESMHADMLSLKSGLGISQINYILMKMELKGVVEQLPGRIFKLKNL